LSVWERLEDVIEASDGHLELMVAAQCCWSGELRIGLTNPPHAPARSMVFFSAGGANPAQVAKRLLADYEDWMMSPDQTKGSCVV
jgi:hypothetical protein